MRYCLIARDTHDPPAWCSPEAHPGAFLEHPAVIRSPTLPLRILFATVILAGVASIRAEDNPTLRRCLSEFGGIRWQLPYAPLLTFESCFTPTSAFGYVPSTDGSSGLRLRGDTSIGFDQEHLRAGDSNAVAQQAVFLHFAKLLLRHGFIMEQPVAELGHSLDTRDAIFTRTRNGRRETMRYLSEGWNSWRLTLSVAP